MGKEIRPVSDPGPGGFRRGTRGTGSRIESVPAEVLDTGTARAK